MDAIWWIVLAIAALIVLALVAWAAARKRRSVAAAGPVRIRCDRTVEHTESRRDAERELRERGGGTDDLGIRPLPEAARRRYADEWGACRRGSSSNPRARSARPTGSCTAWTTVAIRARTTGSQRAAGVSVDYPEVVENYREGHGLWHPYRSSEGDGKGDTEDLRLAMTRFRGLFDELLEGERVEEEVR